jgi:hypothetical protein
VSAIGVVLGSTASRFLVITAVVASVLCTILELYVNWSPALQVDQPGVVVLGQRYSVAPCLFLLTAVAAGLDSSPSGFLSTLVRFAIPAVITVSIGAQLLQGAWQLQGPTWREGVAAAARQCADGRSMGMIQHNPPGWFFGLACTTLVPK